MKNGLSCGRKQRLFNPKQFTKLFFFFFLVGECVFFPQHIICKLINLNLREATFCVVKLLQHSLKIRIYLTHY